MVIDRVFRCQMELLANGLVSMEMRNRRTIVPIHGKGGQMCMRVMADVVKKESKCWNLQWLISNAGIEWLISNADTEWLGVQAYTFSGKARSY